MPNVRLVIEYNGAGFCGWQKQPGLRSIEGELQAVLQTVLREKISALCVAGRTDAGVHARGQVVNFKTATAPDLKRLMRAVSSIMRPELTVHCADLVAEDFHARKSSLIKQYSYTIYSRECPPVLDRGQVWYVAGPLNIELMRAAAQQLVGSHDFTSLRGAGCTSHSPIKQIESSELSWEAPYLRYRVVAKGFLKQMVRNIVGTLVGLGRGDLQPATILEILALRDRRAAGMTAPAFGLCLDWVKYPDTVRAESEL